MAFITIISLLPSWTHTNIEPISFLLWISLGYLSIVQIFSKWTIILYKYGCVPILSSCGSFVIPKTMLTQFLIWWLPTHPLDPVIYKIRLPTQNLISYLLSSRRHPYLSYFRVAVISSVSSRQLLSPFFLIKNAAV